MSESTTQNNDITELRSTLFATLRALGDKDKPMEVERAKAVCEVSQAIINSVKTEIEFAKVTGLQPTSSFIPTAELPKPEPKPALRNLIEKGIVQEPGSKGISYPQPGVTRHTMK